VELGGRICVITGASSGIGRRTARLFAAGGATLCVAARREGRLAALLDELPAGRDHSYVVTDVSSRSDVVALSDHVRARYGRCDVLVNNAGFSHEERFDGPEAVDRLERVMATNFFGAAYLTAELIDLLKASAPSHVVNVSSMAGRLPVAGASGYCASKFALSGWSEALHLELAPSGVYVSVVEPGPIPTEGFPQVEMVANPIFRTVLSTDTDAAEAILSAVVNRKMQRVVPRWFYLLQFPRLIFPPAYRFVQSRFIATRFARQMDSSGPRT
jgi:uncharacterized protein